MIERPATFSVSVVIPALNAEELIPHQLASLASQRSSHPLEVVIADNGSTDGTAVSARQAARDIGIEVRIVDASSTRGVSHARNAGAAAASGTVLLFVDADDELEPRYIDAMVDGLRSNALVSAEHGAPPSDLDIVRPQSPTEPRWVDLAAGNTLGMWRSLLEELRGFDESMRYGEDLDFCIRARRAGVRILCTPEAIVRYRPRSSARAAFRQGVARGTYEPELYRRYGTEFSRPRTARVIVRTWVALVWRLATRWSDDERRETAFGLGKQIGRTRGSVRFRTLFL